jgi:hypothetical protein
VADLDAAIDKVTDLRQQIARARGCGSWRLVRKLHRELDAALLVQRQARRELTGKV